MSNKDDMFEVDEEFSEMGDDFLFGGQKKEVKKVKMPDSVKKVAAEEAAKTEEAVVLDVQASKEAVAEVETVVVESPAEEEAPAAEEAPAEEESPAEEETPAEEEAPAEEAKTEEETPAEKTEKVEKKAKVESKTEKKETPKKSSKPKPAKKKVIQLTPYQKVMNNIYRKAEIESPPTLEHLLREKQGTKVKISDLAVFIKEPEDEVLADLFKGMSKINRVNLSACVDVNRVKVVGGQILCAGRMYQPIQIADIDGSLECTSGRHRLILLALLYGADAEISVYIEKMTINEARDAVVVANMARKTKAMEQAEHAVLQAVGGDIDAGQDEIYKKTVTTKARAKKYCTYTVLERKKPAKLGFKLGTKREGGLATIRTIEGFWGNSLSWHRDMLREDFDKELKSSIEFLNTLATTFQAHKEFDADQHMASMTMSAVGKYYKTMLDAGVTIDASKLVDAVVAMGAIGRQKSESTYDAIIKAMKK